MILHIRGAHVFQRTDPFVELLPSRSFLRVIRFFCQGKKTPRSESEKSQWTVSPSSQLTSGASKQILPTCASGAFRGSIGPVQDSNSGAA